ncbi:GDNF family receptor alpha-like [Gastrophryne carolinensis]
MGFITVEFTAQEETPIDRKSARSSKVSRNCNRNTRLLAAHVPNSCHHTVTSVNCVNCQLKNAMDCNLAIYDFTQKNPEFIACICSEDIYCTIKKIIGKECIQRHVQNVPIRPKKQDISGVEKSHHPKITNPRSAKVNDCMEAKQLCKEDSSCRSLYENFKSQCIHPQECTLSDSVQNCWTAWSKLKTTVMGNCVCINSSKRKCLKVWKSMYNNTCLQLAKERQLSTNSEDNTDLTDSDMESNSYQMIILDWNKSTLKDIEYIGMSCLEVAKLCIADPICNSLLAARMKACTVNENECNLKSCQKIIQLSYESMPFNISQMLAFCDCEQSHENCEHAKDTLHSRPCTAPADMPLFSCPHVVDSCLNNEFCSQRYEVYLKKCWEHASRCHNDKDCLLGLMKRDLICSASDDCRAAYIGTLGTKLQTPCTCDVGLSNFEDHLCGLYFHMLHSKSCFRTMAKNINALHSDSQDKPLTFQGDAVIYIIAYTSGMILISGIILLTLLHARACRSQRKRALPRRNASENLMNS